MPGSKTMIVRLGLSMVMVSRLLSMRIRIHAHLLMMRRHGLHAGMMGERHWRSRKGIRGRRSQRCQQIDKRQQPRCSPSHAAGQSLHHPAGTIWIGGKLSRFAATAKRSRAVPDLSYPSLAALFSHLRQSFRDETRPTRSNEASDHVTTRHILHAKGARMICRLKLILVTLLAGAFMIWAPTAGHAHAGHKHETAHQTAPSASDHSASVLDQRLSLPAQTMFVSSAAASPDTEVQLPCGDSCCSNQSCCSAAIASHPDSLVWPARYRAAPPMLPPSSNTPAATAGPSEPPRSFA